MRANFTRKPMPEEVYPQNEVVIEQEIEISTKEFEHFINNPLNDNEVIAKNKDKMFEDEKGKWHCIFIFAKGYKYGILVESEGSDYARYTAYYPSKYWEDKDAK